MLHRKLALSVVANRGHHNIGGTAKRHAAIVLSRVVFAESICMRARPFVRNGTQRDAAVLGIGARRHHGIALDEFERELFGDKVAALKLLGNRELVGHARANRLYAIAVGERKGRTLCGVTRDLQTPCAVVSHGKRNRARARGVVGNAGGASALADGIDKGMGAGFRCRRCCGIGDLMRHGLDFGHAEQHGLIGFNDGIANGTGLLDRNRRHVPAALIGSRSVAH